jgi:hypothetical protein
MVETLTKHDEDAPVGGKIPVDLAALEQLRRDRANINRMLKQALADNEKGKAALDNLIRQATDSKA